MSDIFARSFSNRNQPRHLEKFRPTRFRGRRTWFTAAFLATLGTSAFGSTRYYVGPDGGNWSAAPNWSNTPSGAGGAGQPLAGDAAILTATSSNISVNYDTNYAGTGLANITLDGAGPATLSMSLSAANTLIAQQFIVGFNGNASVTQNAGNASVGVTPNTFLYLGFNATGAGTYQLSGGQLSSVAAHIGYSGTGNFIQSGGNVTLSSYLSVGELAGSHGTYQLGDGANLKSGVEYIGGIGSTGAVGSGTGNFIQTGGNNTLTSFLSVFSTGNYQLSNGLLSSSQEFLGGSFNQSGGIHSAGFITIYPGATYSLSGGTLQLSQGISNQGTFDFAGGNGTLVANGLVDFSVGTLSNTGNATVQGQSNALIILPAGTDASRFKSLTNAGITHTAGTTLTIAAGQSFNWRGSISDPIACAGTLSGTLLSATRGIAVAGAGNVSLSFLTVTDATSGISDTANLSVQYTENIGAPGSGAVFTQTGGTHSVNPGDNGQLLIGGSPGLAGTYQLSAGTLTDIGGERIGYGGNGTFIQTGGTNYSVYDSTTYVGASNGTGLYQLSAGQLSTANEFIGDNTSSHGTFIQSGGTHAGGNLTIAGAGSGAYQLSGGQLSMKSESIGSGSTFTQTGGNNTVQPIVIGGTYQLFNGTLQATGLQLTGTLDFGSGNSTLFANTIFDFTQGTLLNPQNATIQTTFGTLLLFPKGFDPSQIKSLTGPGMSHVAGTPLLLNSGFSTLVNLTISDPVTCAGNGGLDTGGSFSTITLTNGLIAAGNATVRLADFYNTNDGSLFVNDGNSGLSGNATLISGNETIGGTSSGIFTQTGGRNSVAKLYVGATGGASGAYQLSNGSLARGNNDSPHLEAIGSATSTGVFLQTGGTNTAGANAGGTLQIGTLGAYQLSGGNLTVFQLINQGHFTWSGGSVVSAGSTALIENDQGGVFDIQSDQGFDSSFYMITNDGIFKKSNGSGVALINPVLPFSNRGIVEVDSGTLAFSDVAERQGSALTAGTWLIGANSSLSFLSGNLFINRANVTFAGPNATFPQFATLATNSGSLSLLNGAQLSTAGNLTNSGKIDVAVVSSLIIDGKLTSTSTGSIIGGGTLVADTAVAGALSPGDGPGVLTVKGNLALAATTVLTFDLGDPNAGIGDDRVDVLANPATGSHGDLTLAGKLTVNDLGNFGPGAYTLFTCNGALIDLGLSLNPLPHGYVGTLAESNGIVSLIVVPEPATLSALLPAVGLLLARGRERRSLSGTGSAD